MTPLSQLYWHNNKFIKLLVLLQQKWKLTEDILSNMIGLLMEESWILLEKNNEEEYLRVKDTLNILELVEI